MSSRAREVALQSDTTFEAGQSTGLMRSMTR